MEENWASYSAIQHSTLLSLPQLFPCLVQVVALLGSVKTPLPSHRCHNIKLRRNLSPSQNCSQLDKEPTCHSIPAFFPASGQLSPLASHNCWSKGVCQGTPVITCSSTQPQGSGTVQVFSRRGVLPPKSSRDTGTALKAVKPLHPLLLKSTPPALE